MAKAVRPAGGMDYANRAVITITETAANTLTFQRLVTGVSLFERSAFIVHQLDWFLSRAEAARITALADTITAALTTAEPASIQAGDANVQWLDTLQWQEMVNSSGAATGITTHPTFARRSYPFHQLPGGGIILPATNIFGACQGGSLAGAVTTTLILWYTPIQLTPEEYWQLVEATRVLSAP